MKAATKEAERTVLGIPVEGMPEDLVSKGWQLYASETTPPKFRARNNRYEDGVEIGPYPKLEELVGEAQTITDEAEEQAAIREESGGAEATVAPAEPEQSVEAECPGCVAAHSGSAIHNDLHDENCKAAQEADATIEKAKKSAGSKRAEEVAREKRPTVTTLLAASSINPDVALQMRTEGLNMLKVAEYVEAKQAGDKFPAVDVFHDFETGEKHLAGGAHRHAADTELGQEVLANVHDGTKRDALLFALGENATHGLPRTNADKRRAVLIILKDSEWSRGSDGAVANKAKVSQPFVSEIRRVVTALAIAAASGRKWTDEDIAEEASATVGLVRAIRAEWVTQNVLSGDQSKARVGRDGIERDTSKIGRKSDEEKAAVAEQERAANPELFKKDKASEPDVTNFEEDTEEELAQQKARRDAAGGWSTDDVIATMTKAGGTMYRGQLEEAGCSYAAILNAIADDAIEQPEVGLYRLREGGATGGAEKAETAVSEGESATTTPSASAAAQSSQETKSFHEVVDDLLKGRMLSVSFTWIPGLKGRVQLRVNASTNPADAATKMVDAESVRPFSKDVLQMITEKLKSTPAASKPKPLTVDRKGTAKLRKSQSASVRRSQSRASKAAKKKPAKKSAAKKKKR